MLHSTTPSPTKSPRRQALSSKDSNIRHSPLIKPLTSGSTPQLSPSRVSKPLSNSTSISPKRLSPTKVSTRTATVFTKPTPQLGFSIFEDLTDYSTELQLSSTLAIKDENDVVNNKENLATRSPLNNTLRRVVLGDLDILENPGYITYHSRDSTAPLDPRRGVYQLDSLWNTDGTKSIPSYVTPPRHDRVKYISFTQEKAKLKRSSSSSDLKEKVVKKLVFGIHKDNNTSQLL